MSEIKTPTAREAMHCFIGAMRAHRRIFDEMRERTGLGRTSHRILMILSENPDGCSQTCLAEKLEISIEDCKDKRNASEYMNKFKQLLGFDLYQRLKKSYLG